jgi:hypothetical protein
LGVPGLLWWPSARVNSDPSKSSPFIRWMDLPARNAAFSLESFASHATTWASAPLRSASMMTLPGSGMNILRMFGSLKLSDSEGENWVEGDVGNAVLVSDILSLIAGVDQ